MSLEHVAAHLAAKGRGPDETLVHMSGKELAGLQALANMHGGSLTANPHTGLPEAGFLDSILPTLIGVGAALAFPEFSLLGMGAPASIGLGIGAEEALRTGDLGKGIMSGLGAYGGAGLAPGLDSAFGAQAAANAANANVAGATANEAGREMLSAGPWGSAAQTPVASSLGTSGMMKYGAAAAAPAIIGAMQPQMQAPQGAQQMIRPYTFTANPQTPANMVSTSYQPGQDTSERMWFQPQYTALTPYKAAEGGIVALAGGGPVERMSNANAIGRNTGYPQADIEGHAYATPWQTPISENMVTGTADTGVNRMTGEMNFAAGGITGDGNLNLHIPLDFGGSGFGGASANGYQAAGSGTSTQTGFSGYNNAPGQSAGGFGIPASSAPGPFQPIAANVASGGVSALAAAANSNGTPFDLNSSLIENTYHPEAAAQGPGMLSGGNPYAAFYGSTGGGTSGPATTGPAPTSDNPYAAFYGSTGGGSLMAGRGASLMGSGAGGSFGMAAGGLAAAYASGGISTLGGYSDGGRLLRGPGDGMSDNIPAQIGEKQPARLADGEFVVPADVVSHLGNGSTDAGAKQLYKMMNKVRQARTGNPKQGKQINPNKFVPA